MREKREITHLYVDSNQNQAETHQNSDQTELINGGTEALETEIDHRENEEPCKSEKQSKTPTAHQSENGEKSETAHEEVVDDETEAERDREKESDCGESRERMKRHRTEVSGHVWIPDLWGQEDLLMDWIDSSEFDACLIPKGIISARASLVEEGRTVNSVGIRVENSC